MTSYYQSLIPDEKSEELRRIELVLTDDLFDDNYGTSVTWDNNEYLLNSKGLGYLKAIESVITQLGMADSKEFNAPLMVEQILTPEKVDSTAYILLGRRIWSNYLRQKDNSICFENHIPFRMQIQLYVYLIAIDVLFSSNYRWANDIRDISHVPFKDYVDFYL